jgi:REP element-mobilizing transposase RayT
MPDHVHLLFSPLEGPDGVPFGLSEIMQGIKGASAHSVNKSLGRSGRVWEPEYYDRLLRREESVLAAASYILQNPVRKGLVGEGEAYEWVWSAFDTFVP